MRSRPAAEARRRRSRRPAGSGGHQHAFRRSPKRLGPATMTVLIAGP